MPGDVSCKNAHIKFQAGAYVDPGDFFQQLRIIHGGRVCQHQRIRRVKEGLWVHGKHLFHGNKIVFRRIGAIGRCVFAALFISRERHQLHRLLNCIHIGKILLPGKDNTGNKPGCNSGYVNPRHPVGQFSPPVGKGKRISASCFEYGNGIGPCIQNLHIKKPVGFGHDIHNRLVADIEPRLCVNSVHIGRYDSPELCIRQLLRMDELIDGSPAGNRALGIGRQRFCCIHDDKREGKGIRLAHKRPRGLGVRLRRFAGAGR